MPFTPAGTQLVIEVYVRDLARSREFYQSLGFELLRAEADFIELRWEDHLLFLASGAGLPSEVGASPANVRILVPDVDRYWGLANDLGARVLSPIGDRYYGLRDFKIADPDGFGLRFATPL